MILRVRLVRSGLRKSGTLGLGVRRRSQLGRGFNGRKKKYI